MLGTKGYVVVVVVVYVLVQSLPPALNRRMTPHMVKPPYPTVKNNIGHSLLARMDS
jgi:hypothetical protein